MDLILIKTKLGGSGKKYPVKYSKANFDKYGLPKLSGWKYREATEDEAFEFAAKLGVKLTKKKEKKEEQ